MTNRLMICYDCYEYLQNESVEGLKTKRVFNIYLLVLEMWVKKLC